MSNGIAHNNLNDISKIYLDTISDINKKEQADDVKRWQKEETECKKESPFKKKKNKDLPFTDDVSETKYQREDAQSDALAQMMGDGGDPQDDAIKQIVRAEKKAAKKKKVKKESFSNWRTDLREITSDAEAVAIDNQPEIKEKKVKNKIKINPEFKEAVKEMGGELLEVTEVGDDKDDEKASQKEKKLKLRLLRLKMMATKQNVDSTIVTHYEPEIEDAVEYFYEQGINEEGLQAIIEDVGIDDFIKFVFDDEEGFLAEERDARKMNVRTLKATKKKAEEIKANKKDVVARGTPKDTLARARAERSIKKPKLAKPSAPKKPEAPKKPAPAKKPAPSKKVATVAPVAKVKPVAKKPVAKKVVKAVAKVKKTQPKKEVSKSGLRDKIRSAVKAGVKRHKKAVQPARVFAKGAVRGAKDTVKFAGKVKKVLTGEENTMTSVLKRLRQDRLDEVQVTRLGDAQQKAMQDAVLKRKEELKKKEKEKVKEEVIDERLGGKGTSRKAGAAKIHPTSGDWEDSDRGAGNKSARRAGKKVEKKSPTYLAHVHNKKVKKEEVYWSSEALDQLDELNRYEKEKGKSTGSASYRSGVNTPRKGTLTKKGGSSDKIVHFGKGLVRGAEGRPTGQTRKSYDARGKETDRREPPSRTMERIRSMRRRADAAMRDTSGT